AEAIVYGVQVDKLDGRAGMAAITPGADFKIEGLHDFLAEELPAYARPLFLRLIPEIETPGTFKYRKLDLEQEGFDPARIEHGLYFDDPEQKTYTPLTPDLYERIQSGAVRL